MLVLRRIADWCTRAVDRVLIRPEKHTVRPITPQRWDRLVAARAVTEHEDDRPA